MITYLKTHHCGALRKPDVDKTVRLSGWVHRRRDFGGLIFIDLRDHGGLTQLIFHPDMPAEIYDAAKTLRSEWVITVQGTVASRAEGMTNATMPTGDIEILVNELDILSPAKTPPLTICDDSSDIKEELTLKYRYLEMRKGKILDHLALRHKVFLAIRNFLDAECFKEITTPVLSKSSPEGAREYLVPSRVHPSCFYALPQSPQIFKQLLMIGGLDKYFQIAPCFRDEDLRSDRQPEFTQLDIEWSFETVDRLFDLIERLCRHVYETSLQKKLPLPFPRLTYRECMDRYGTDKPDIRIPFELKEMSHIAKKTLFAPFLRALEKQGIVKGMCIPQGGELSGKQIDRYADSLAEFGIGSIFRLKLTEGKLSSNIVKFLPEEEQEALIHLYDMKENDLLLLVADSEKSANKALDHLRRRIACDRHLLNENSNAFLWVTDFPLFVRDDEENLVSCHHPFTAVHPEDEPLLDHNPESIRSLSYDLVLNGYEIASGSQRIHQPAIQEKIFEILRLSPEEVRKKFGFFVEALTYGTPPHLGIALGLDRMMMLFLGTNNIRDVIAFPKNQKASDLMTQAPSPPDSSRLQELKINIER